jgi:hypothetical protein
MSEATKRLEARKTIKHITFEQWLAFLDTAALTAGFRSRIAACTDQECWKDFYEDGYTPTRALAEDLSRA